MSEPDKPRVAIEPDWTKVALPGLGPDTVALITGGSGAIGLRAAEVLAGWGARMALMGRSSDRVEEAANSLDGSGEAMGIAGDVAREEDALMAVDAAVSRWGRLDVLIHSAAVGGSKPLEAFSASEIDLMLEINLKGTLLMAKAASAQMRTAGRGKIVNVASIAAHRAAHGNAVYGATKAGVVHLTRQLAVELSPYGINVNSISPGQTPTAIRQLDESPGGRPQMVGGTRGKNMSRIPLRRRGVLDDCVGPILFLASDLADYITGADIPVEGGAMVVR